jgi:hypothetical protein
MDSKSIFLLGILGDAIVLGHFHIAESVCNCLYIELHFAPSQDGCLLGCLENSCIGDQVKQFDFYVLNLADHIWVTKDCNC